MQYYRAEVLDVIEILLTDLLTFRSVKIKFIEAFMEELVGADDSLLQLGELLGQFELL